jgi:hypothetical protein
MGQNFIEGRREQGFFLPPDVREWLPADHLAWFVIDAVAGMDPTRSMRRIGLMVMVGRRMSRRWWWRWSCMRLRPGCGRRGRSSVIVARTWGIA